MSLSLDVVGNADCILLVCAVWDDRVFFSGRWFLTGGSTRGCLIGGARTDTWPVLVGLIFGNRSDTWTVLEGACTMRGACGRHGLTVGIMLDKGTALDIGWLGVRREVLAVSALLFT